MKYDVGSIYYFGDCGGDDYGRGRKPRFIKILEIFERRNGYKSTGIGYKISQCKKDGTLFGDCHSWSGERLEERNLLSLSEWIKEDIKMKKEKIEKLKNKIYKMEKELKKEE
jgi:hypothetical protein